MSNPFSNEIIIVILSVRGILSRGFRCFLKQNNALRRPLEFLKGNAKAGEETPIHISLVTLLILKQVQLVLNC